MHHGKREFDHPPGGRDMRLGVEREQFEGRKVRPREQLSIERLVVAIDRELLRKGRGSFLEG